MSIDDLQLTHIPSVQVGMLIRRPPGEVFQALVDPASGIPASRAGRRTSTAAG
jgi:hypothetical protein